MLRCRRRAMILSLAAALPLAGEVRAATLVFANPNGGALNVSTNWLPSGIPGAGDTAQISALPTIAGPLTLTLTANQSIGTLALDHFAQTTINAGIDPNTGQTAVLTLATGQLAFTNAITEGPDVPLSTLLLNAPIAGGAGLTKSGVGFANLSAVNLYTGGTTITGAGGLSVAADSALGAAGGSVSLTAGGTLRAISGFATSRAINVDTAGRIESFGTLTLNGAVGGTGTLTIGRFTGGAVTFANASNTFAGNLVIANGNRVNLTGRLASVSAITVGGTLDLGTGSGNTGAAVIPQAAPINSLGGTITMAGGPAANTTASLGALTLSAGTSTLNLEPTVGGGASMTFTNLTRNDRATLFVRGRDLGTGALAANRAVIDVLNGATQVPITVVGGGGTTGTNDSIVPWMFGNKNVTGGTSQISAVEAGFVARNAFGLAPLDGSRYATTLGANATDNVRVSDTILTQNSAATLNALLIRDTMNSFGNTGVTGSGTLNITSGAIGAVSDLAGEELFIDNPINFGASEGVVHTAPTSDGYSQLILRGALSGTNGLTKAGAGDLYLQNTASTYSGITTIDAGILTYTGSVIGNQPSALGNSSADVIINAGSTPTQYVGLQSDTPLSTFARNIVVRQSASANSLAFLGTLGGYGTNFSGQITVEGGFLNLLGDTEAQVLTLSGNVVGPGGLEEPAVSTPLPQYLRLTGNNTYSGGTIIRAGRWDVGSDTALGTGAVYFEGNRASATAQTGAIQAFGGARSLANALVFRASPLVSGADALTFTGGIDLGSVARDVTVTNTADTTFAGVVSRGGLTKRGAGRLILSGPNTYNGQTIVAAGTLRVASNAALGEATGPAGIAQATFIGGTGTLELTNNIATSEAIYFGANGLPISVASPTGNLRNVSGDNTINTQIAFDDVGTVGVDAGSSLTLNGDTADNTALGTAVLRKVGTGTLVVKNVRLPSLVINAGTVRVASRGAPLGTSRVSSLTIDAGATLDLANNSLIYDYTTTSPMTAVRSLLQNGRIVTSVTTPNAAVGYAEASSLFAANTFPQSYGGLDFDNTTLVVTQTIKGDTNLDRTVNFADLLTLAQNYGTTGQFWRNGDFTYDGAVDFSDLLALAQSYGASAVDTAALTSIAGSGFEADWALAQSLVPEPTTLAMLTLLAPLTRRRRSSSSRIAR